MDAIKEHIAHITRRIEAACKRVNRNPVGVQILLATKTIEPSRILTAFSCGCTLIGENKVQELCKKAVELSIVPHTTHFIGHLQTNKVKQVLQYADCIQSIDRLEIARLLEKHLAFKNRSIDVLIQVNTSQEKQKSGCMPEHTAKLIRDIMQLPHLRIKGFMTIGPISDDTNRIRMCFRLLRTLQQDIRRQIGSILPLETLSMGMSDDLEIAVEEGSTLVRVGSAVFGKRT